MTTADLHSNQALLRQRYRADPATARTTLRAHASTGADVTCRIETGTSRPLAGMHPGLGGSGREACPGDMLLEALAACAGVTLRAVAARMGLELRSATVTTEGDLDFRGLMSLAPDVPVGFQAVRLRFTLDTDATDAQIGALLRHTEAFCVVSQALAMPPEFSFVRASAAS